MEQVPVFMVSMSTVTSEAAAIGEKMSYEKMSYEKVPTNKADRYMCCAAHLTIKQLLQEREPLGSGKASYA